MRPRNTTLRRHYEVAAEELRVLKRPVTPRTLSVHLSKEYNAVRTFFNRNRTFAKELGVKIINHHSEEQYVGTKEKLEKEKVKPTSRAIAAELGVDHSSVCRFFKKHPQRLANAENPATEAVPSVVVTEPEPPWRKAMRTPSHELTVQHFDTKVVRVVLNKVTPAEYIKLWDNGHLLFQIRKEPKPDSLPTREEMVAFL